LLTSAKEPPVPETYDAHKTTTEVRQGSRRQMNLRVLVISGVLIVVAFAVILLVFFVAAPGNAVAP
jgi:hypothetical protein